MELLFMTLVIACSVVSVRGQIIGVVCRASVNCAGGLVDDLGRTTERGCCVDNPLGLAYVGGEGLCVPCIVLGFFQDSFSGVEQGPGHSVQVGYQKGAQVFRQNLVFRVLSTPGTAREGPQFDYTVNTLTARAFFGAANPDNVVATFRVDTIAQEPNETFTLTLDPFQTTLDEPRRDGLFFQDTIEMTIVDNDDVEFLFTEDDFQANENGTGGSVSLMPVRVAKNRRIASRIELVIVPLTVQEARGTALPLPPNVPDNNPFSPPFATLNDFNNANITLIFEPDEDGTSMNERDAPIPIVDDAINEATEQVFIVEFRLVSSLDRLKVNLSTRPSSLCRIIDNDPIGIGFELPGYTYMETMFEEIIDGFYMSPTGLPINGPIYLVKENDVISEQSFLVSMQVTDSTPSGTSIQPATLEVDYRLAAARQTSVTRPFLASVRRISFQFTLFPDDLPEGNEAFRASISPQDTRMNPDGSIETFPTFLNPNSLASEIFVVIEDDDPIVIGFADTSYTVNEAIGMLEVDVRVFNPPDGETLPVSIELVIQTVSGSATGGSDYQEIFAVDLNPFLFFANNARQQTFSVAITNDSYFEMDVEDFSLELRFNPFAAPPSNVQLSPNVSVVEILEDDVLMFGSEPTVIIPAKASTEYIKASKESLVLLSSTDGIIPPNVRLEPTRAITTKNDLTKAAGTNSTLIAVVLACTVVFFTLITAVMIVICIVVKKWHKRKIKLPEHVYESVPLPQCTVTSLPEPIKLDGDEGTDSIELTDNEAYSTIKPQAAAAAETALNTESTTADL